MESSTTEPPLQHVICLPVIARPLSAALRVNRHSLPFSPHVPQPPGLARPSSMPTTPLLALIPRIFFEFLASLGVSLSLDFVKIQFVASG